MNEYQYLEQLILDRYDRLCEELIIPLLEKHKQAIISGEYVKVLSIQNDIDNTRIKLLEQKMRAEDIIHWLNIDTCLRRAGTNYPTIMERSNGEYTCQAT